MTLTGSTVLITGGTGSFGRRCVAALLEEHSPRKIIVFSRDELKQHEMRTEGYDDSSLRYFIGDIRDPSRLRRALHGVDYVIHAAALKQVPVCEYNPFEAIATNVTGAQNIIEAALDVGVKAVLALSTDKAVNPVNLYGATKLCAEKLFVQGNAYAPGTGAKFACVRYGNVVGSRGSVIPLFLKQRETGCITLTHPDMTRFWITLDQGVRFVLRSLTSMRGGEIFVPKIPSMKLVDLARAIAPGCRVDTIGVRPGEKIHEVLVSEDEARHALEFDDMFLIEPTHPWWTVDKFGGGTAVPEGFAYSSDRNRDWLDVDQLRALVDGSAQ